MAVKLISGALKRYQGLSTDTKPTAGVAEGSTFLETDTGQRFLFDGAGWVSDSVQPVAGAGADGSLVNTSVAWANSAAANTANDVNVPTPANPSIVGKCLILVHNPSAVTALTGTIKIRWNDNQATPAARVSTLREGASDKTIAIPANSAKGFVVEGWVLATGGRITFTNDTLLGAADGFTAYVQVRAL